MPCRQDGSFGGSEQVRLPIPVLLSSGWAEVVGGNAGEEVTYD